MTLRRGTASVRVISDEGLAILDASIIITAFNYERFVASCIESCLDQRGFSGQFEVIVIDDGSTDGTLAEASKYASKVRLFSGTNAGVESAANQALLQAKGAAVVRVDADDRLLPDYLAESVPCLSGSDAAFVYSGYTVIDADDHCVREVNLPDFDPAEIRARGDFLATGTLFCKSSIAKLGYYRTHKTNCGLENFDLILRLLKDGQTGVCLHKPLFCYRQHGNNMSERRRSAIIEYGNVIGREFGFTYRTNANHPYGLTL